MFVSSTPFKVIPLKQINAHKFDNAPGPLTRKIAELMGAIVGGNDNRFKKWLYMVE
jgi:branched-subunit amino acid aminotransferase/4-amino-4-deoxychorismate lyase